MAGLLEIQGLWLGGYIGCRDGHIFGGAAVAPERSEAIDLISGFDVGDVCRNRIDDARKFVARNRGEAGLSVFGLVGGRPGKLVLGDRSGDHAYEGIPWIEQRLFNLFVNQLPRTTQRMHPHCLHFSLPRGVNRQACQPANIRFPSPVCAATYIS